MDKYKSINKYLSKQKSKKEVKCFLAKLLFKIMICIVIFLTGLIVLRIDKNNDQVIYKYLSSHNISFASVNKWFSDKFGDILPFQKIVKENVTPVFEEKIKYKDSSIYKDGVKLVVDNNYLVPIIESGIVVFIGEKEEYGNTVIIQQIDGVDTWYANVSNVNVDLYDYVNKGEFLGEVNEVLYLVFSKDGKYLNYQEYLN